MNLEFQQIKINFSEGYQITKAQTGKLAKRSIKALTNVFGRAKQDRRLAALTLVAANVAFFATTYLILNIFNHFIEKAGHAHEDWSNKRIALHSVVILTLGCSLLVGFNVALYRTLKLPLSPLMATVISVATCWTSCLTFLLIKKK